MTDIETAYEEAKKNVVKKPRRTPEQIGLAKPKRTKEEMDAYHAERKAAYVQEYAGDKVYCTYHRWSAIRAGHYSAGSHTPHCIKCGVKGETELLRGDV